MGNWTVLCLLALVGGASALRCNVGSVTTDAQGKVIRQYGRVDECDGYCTVKTISSEVATLHIMSCEQKESFVKADKVCKENSCNVVEGMTPFTDDSHVRPAGFRTCYVGISIGTNFIGGDEFCESPCAAIDTTTNLNNQTVPVTAYFCAPYELCDAFAGGPDNTNSIGNLNATCCFLKPTAASTSNCNVMHRPGRPTVIPPVEKRWPPVACYSGVHFNGTLVSGGEYTACDGDCASLTYTGIFGIDLTLYSCDPATVCKGIGLENDCLSVDNGMFQGCCCNSDACIDPFRGIYPNGTRNLIRECFVGLHTATSNSSTTIGQPLICDGKCGRVSTTVLGTEVEAFYCSPNNWCQLFDIQDTCGPILYGNINATACCCSDSDNCNTHGTDVTPAPPTTIRPHNMIACYEAIHINGFALSGGERFVACDGDCASVTLASTLAGGDYNLTMYTCDPASLCRSLNVTNRCANILGGGISGCCCDTDLCIEPRRNKYPNGTVDGDLKCFTGVQVGSRDPVGNPMPCNGECATVASTVNGVSVHAFFCAPKSLCEVFGLDNECATMLGINPPTTTCCCKYRDSCNLHQRGFEPQPYVPQTGSPISCYEGMAFNGYVFTDQDSYVSCRGSCGVVSFATSYAGTPLNVSMFTCDPSTVCKNLNMTNTCGAIGPIEGCCCDWNDCLDIPTRTVKRNPADPLNCFVGMELGSNNGTSAYGSSMSCNGECASVTTKVNGNDVTGYFCAPKKLCDAFDISSSCATLFHDQGSVKGCCCADSDDCNVKDSKGNVPSIIPTGVAPTGPPITCYAGLMFNKALLTAADQYMVCNGDCASITFTTTIANFSTQTTMFTCDPIALCGKFGLNNSCGAIGGPMISSCCCNSNDCLDLNNLSVKPTKPPTPTQSVGTVSLLSGLSALLVTLLMRQ